MAVIAWGESVASRSASVSAAEGFTYTRSFQVQVDDPNTPMIQVMSAPRVFMWARYPSDIFSFAQSFEARPRGSSQLLYDVVIQYKPAPKKDQERKEQEPDTPQDPEAFPQLMPGPVWNGGGSLRETQTTRTVNGKIIANSAGVPYPDVTKRTPAQTISVTKCYATFTRASTAMTALHGKTNSAAWAGGAIGEWLCESTRWSWRTESNGNKSLNYLEVTFDFARIAGGHDLELVDQGFQERKAGKLTPILNDQGKPVTEPVFLNGSGAQMNPAPTPTTDPWVLTFPMFAKADFDAIVGSPPDKL